MPASDIWGSHLHAHVDLFSGLEGGNHDGDGVWSEGVTPGAVEGHGGGPGGRAVVADAPGLLVKMKEIVDC